MVETPHTCEQNKRNQRKRNPTQPNNTTKRNKPKQAGKTAEFHLCTSKVKHGEKGELRLIATWATNSNLRCCRFVYEEALCDRPVCGQAKSQALADASAQAIWQLPTVSCAGKVPSECKRSSLMVMEQCSSGLGRQLSPGHNRYKQLRMQEKLWPMSGSMPLVVVALSAPSGIR